VSASFPRIIRILAVKDTRQYEEGPDDRFYPIPGSGEQHCCARCSKLHEIHATVLLENNQEAVVGRSCAKKDSIEISEQCENTAKLAIRLAKLNAQELAFTASYRAWETAWKAVLAMPVPPATLTYLPIRPDGARDGEYRVGVEGWARIFRPDVATPKVSYSPKTGPQGSI